MVIQDCIRSLADAEFLLYGVEQNQPECVSHGGGGTKLLTSGVGGSGFGFGATSGLS